jgi:hypothetical protein
VILTARAKHCLLRLVTIIAAHDAVVLTKEFGSIFGQNALLCLAQFKDPLLTTLPPRILSPCRHTHHVVILAPLPMLLLQNCVHIAFTQFHTRSMRRVNTIKDLLRSPPVHWRMPLVQKTGQRLRRYWSVLLVHWTGN